MRKYYLFIINKDYKSIYSSNSNTLYQMLYNLYKLSFDDLRIGFSIYNQICKTFNKKILMNYFKEKYNLKKKNPYLAAECGIATNGCRLFSWGQVFVL